MTLSCNISNNYLVFAFFIDCFASEMMQSTYLNHAIRRLGSSTKITKCKLDSMIFKGKLNMSSKIRILNDHTINKIAAGEVIENPASVVKELVENSMDAGADTITIEIRQGGRQLIRITDNGCGMSPDDALLCLERHATSKIKEVEDIQDLLTMGFRGEAIPSIASISKCSILTCPDSEKATQQGTLVLVEGGRIISAKPAVRSVGTTIEIKSLFFNVPVRRKFQRSPTYDMQAIQKMIHVLSLSHPAIRFELICDEKPVLQTPPILPEATFTELLKLRIEAILGQEMGSDLISLEMNQTPYELKGYIGLPHCHKPNRNHQFLFINKRAVFSPMVSAVIKEAYGTMLPSQRFPVFVLHLNLPGEQVDVNVHPQKKEVRIRQEHALKQTLIQAIQFALNGHHQIPLTGSFAAADLRFGEMEICDQPSFKYQPEAVVSQDKWEFKQQVDPFSFPKFSVNESLTQWIEDVPELPREEQATFFPLHHDHPTVVGMIKGYLFLDPNHPKLASIVGRSDGGVCVVDQKAASTRIRYEKLLKNIEAGSEVQSLLIPISINVSALQSKLLLTHLETLNQMGFSIREFGHQSFVIDAFPDFIHANELVDFIHDLTQELLETEGISQIEQLKLEKIAMQAARRSIGSLRQLNKEEANQLVKELFDCKTPFVCPLGNKIIALASPKDFAALF